MPVLETERLALRRLTTDDAEFILDCGLLKRDSLPDADIGFALLPRYWSEGYAFESASAVLAHARDMLGLKRVLAVTSPDNVASIDLLEDLGFRFEGMSRLAEGAPEIRVFSRNA
jgi:RimJ/RimL family protein N-acetyltransferase